jgi:dTDP-4-dehydrorhamnose reductase
LGAELCRLLAAEAIGVDIDTLDLTDRAAVRETLRRLAPRAVVHCAAYTQVDQAETDAVRCRAVNVTAVETLADACRELDSPLVQLSTDYLFTGSPRPAPTSECPPRAPDPAYRVPRPWREDDPPAPKGVYAVTKFEGEQAAAAWPKHLIVRTCGLYARPSHVAARNFVKTILRLARTQPKLRVVDDQWCTPTYVPHLARAIVYLLGTHRATPAPWGIYNVTNRGETTWCNFAREIVRRAGLDVPVEPITTADFAAPAPRPAYSVLDTTAYHRLGGPPMPDWKEALGEYFEELKQ